MERNDNNNPPIAFQSFTIDNHKLKITLFANKLTIELQNLENQKTYSYEFPQDGNQQLPYFVDSIPDFYRLLYETLKNLKEGYHVQIFPDEKIKLYYKGKTNTRIIDLTFDCPVQEIFPLLPIDFECQGIPLSELDASGNENHSQVPMNPFSQKDFPTELGISQKSLVQSEIIGFAELGLEIQNLLQSYGGQQNASELLNSFIRETKKKFKELENNKEKIEEEVKNSESQEQAIRKKLSDEFEDRLTRCMTELEEKFQEKIQQMTQDYIRLNADVRNNNSKINSFEKKIWGNSTITPHNQESFVTRLEKISVESKEKLKGLENKLEEYENSLLLNSQYSSEKALIKLQKELQDLKESQQIEQAENKSLLDQLTVSIAKENDLKNQVENLKTSVESMRVESSESTNQILNFITQISDLQKEVQDLESSKAILESKINKVEALQDIEAQMRKLIIPSNKELNSFDKKKLQFDPELFDLTLQLKDDNEISMNAFADRSTKRIYSHKPLPDSGKFMFSINFKDLKLGENGAASFGVAPFKTQQELKGLPGSFLVNVREGQAYLGTHTVKFKSEQLAPQDVLRLYVNLQDEWIHFSINNRFVLHEKIDTEKWEQGKTYGGIITTACERLNASFV